MRFVSIGRWVLCLDYITHVQAFHGVDEELIAAEVHMTGSQDRIRLTPGEYQELISVMKPGSAEQASVSSASPGVKAA